MPSLRVYSLIRRRGANPSEILDGKWGEGVGSRNPLADLRGARRQGLLRSGELIHSNFIHLAKKYCLAGSAAISPQSIVSSSVLQPFLPVGLGSWLSIPGPNFLQPERARSGADDLSQTSN